MIFGKKLVKKFETEQEKNAFAVGIAVAIATIEAKGGLDSGELKLMFQAHAMYQGLDLKKFPDLSKNYFVEYESDEAATRQFLEGVGMPEDMLQASMALRAAIMKNTKDA